MRTQASVVVLDTVTSVGRKENQFMTVLYIPRLIHRAPPIVIYYIILFTDPHVPA